MGNKIKMYTKAQLRKKFPGINFKRPMMFLRLGLWDQVYPEGKKHGIIRVIFPDGVSRWALMDRSEKRKGFHADSALNYVDGYPVCWGRDSHKNSVSALNALLTYDATMPHAETLFAGNL